MKVVGRPGNQGANIDRSLEMKRILFATLLAGCTNNADIGISNQPVTCKPTAEGAAHGTVTNTTTNKSYTFGSVTATMGPAQGTAVILQDSTLSLSLSFSCGSTDLATYEVGAGQVACPLMVNSAVSAANQQVYVFGHSGELILDQNSGCFAGRYDVDFAFGDKLTPAGEVAGWFSIPLQ
jgi:hypothetical protein